MYRVLQFTEAGDSGLAIVHEKWLTPLKKEVFWPPYKDTNSYKRALKDGEEVERTWKLYTVGRFFYETDDLKKAEEKLKLAETQSDLASDADKDDAERSENLKWLPTRRMRKPPRRLVCSSDEDDNQSDDNPRPPKIKHNVLVSLNETKKSIYESPVLETVERNHFTPSHSNSQIDFSLTRKSTANSSGTHQKQSETKKSIYESPVLETVERNHFTPSHSNSQIDFSLTRKSTANSSGTHQKQSEFQVLLTHILEIKQENKKILKLLCKQSEEKKGGLPLDFPLTLPLESIKNLEKLEAHLKLSTNFTEFVPYLSSFGGRDIVSKTNRILKEVLSDNLAAQFNFFGRNRKKAFGELTFNQAIISSVKASSLNSVTTKDIEDVIKVWLKQAPNRIKRKIRKTPTNSQVDEQMDGEVV